MMNKEETLVHVAKIENLRYDCEFITTNDRHVWKDTPKGSAVNASYHSRREITDTVPFSYVEDVKWTTVIVRPGFQANIRGKDNIKRGDTPDEAVSYLNFDETYKIRRPPVTEKQSVRNQIQDILRSLSGAVHFTTVPKYLNKDKLDDDYTSEDIKDILVGMDSTYKTRTGDEWWSTRK